MILILRHGETEWNVAGRFQGHGDSPLTPLGRRQADAAARHVAAHALAATFSSPLARVRFTAERLAGLTGLQPVYDPRLKECDYGRFEGLTRAEIEARAPGCFALREADKWNRAFPGAESYADVAGRAASFADEHLGGAAGVGPPHVCVVAHSGFNITLIGHLLGWSPSETLALRQPNDVIYRVADGALSPVQLELAVAPA